MNKTAEIAHRIRDFGEKKFPTMAEFAAALGMTPQSLQSYLSGRQAPGKIVKGKLRALGADVDYIMTGRRSNESQVRMRPVYAAVPAGVGEIREETGIYDYAPPGVEDEGKGYWLIVKGDSMAPVFKDGQRVFINPTREVRDGDYAVVIWNDHTDGAIKQILFQEESIILNSINPLHRPITIYRNQISRIERVCYIKL